MTVTCEQRLFNANKTKTEVRHFCLKHSKTRYTPVKQDRESPAFPLIPFPETPQNEIHAWKTKFAGILVINFAVAHVCFFWECNSIQSHSTWSVWLITFHFVLSYLLLLQLVSFKDHASIAHRDSCCEVRFWPNFGILMVRFWPNFVSSQTRGGGGVKGFFFGGGGRAKKLTAWWLGSGRRWPSFWT